MGINNQVSDNPLIFGDFAASILSINGNVGIGTTNPVYPLQMKSSAYVTTGGVWTSASSRSYKENIQELQTEKALDAFRKLNPVTFSYIADPEERRVGFIAEDVSELVATKGSSAESVGKNEQNG